MDIDAMQTENDLEELQFQCEILLVESFHTMAKLTNAGINSIILRPPTVFFTDCSNCMKRKRRSQNEKY